MTINFVYTGQPMNGDDDDEFFIAYKGSTGTDHNTVNAGGGDDLVVGDSSDTWIPNESNLNGSIAEAYTLETLTSTWTTGQNQMFGDWSLPHTTVIAETTMGESEYFRVQIGAGQQITIDIDFASSTAIGNPRDLVVELQDYLGNIIAIADDSLVTDGGRGSAPSTPGSLSSYDPFLSYTVANAGIYYINVRPADGGSGATFTDNHTFVMNLTITGHAVNASNPVQGNDTISGGDGNDALFGQGGDDTINGDGGDDLIDSGSGGDIVHGGEGNDTLYGGDGSEENIHGDNGNDRLISGGEGHYYGDDGDDVIVAGLTTGVNEVLDGGAGVDTIDTTSWNGAYVIDLLAGTTDFGEIFTNFENAVTGNGADIITGTAGANDISTRGGIDKIDAGAGNDIVAGGADGDVLDGGSDHDILNYRASSGAVTIDLISGTAAGGHATGDDIANFEGVWGSVLGDTLTADAGDNELRGYEGSDTLSGGIGNDILDGGLNDDTMTGGTGDDTYYMDSPSDTIVELAGEGTDTLAVGFSYTLANDSPLERLATLDPAANVAINLTGNAGVNTLTGNAGANALDGRGGADTMTGLGGDDWYYVDNAGDLVVEGAADGGNDRVLAGISYTLAAGLSVEKLTTIDNNATTAIDLTGNEIANVVYGNAGANVLDGKSGADTLIGLGGDDTYHVDNAADVVTEGTGQGGKDRVLASVSYALGAGVQVEELATVNALATTAINLTGNELANVLTGNAGANVLDGAGGADTLIGLGGDDWYLVDSAADAVVEGASQGANDRVFASVSYALAAGVYVERLTTNDNDALTAINLTGNELVNTIYGNAGANVLDGKAGADNLIGLGGDDWYYVDNAADAVSEGTGQGAADRVFAGISYTLGAGVQVEKLTTVDNLATTAINLTGNELANIVYGNAGANVLDGRGGADTLIGLAGDDWYYVDNAADLITEGAAEGALDRVFASVSYTLAAGVHIERLTTVDVAGMTAINLTGNELANTVYGNAGANTLDGKAGADVLAGQNGDDWYYVDSAADVVIETAGQGANDRVLASVSYTLGAGVQVERLTTVDNLATTAINLTGNELANMIYGNAGANTLDGKAGADTLIGLAGDDWYHVDNAADVVSEAAGQGANDRIFASVSYALAAGVQVERLTTVDNLATTAIDLTGNELANIVFGNAGANLIDGKAGADTLIGLAGADTFAFTTALGGGNVDAIGDFSVADDTIRLENAVFTGLAAGALAAGTFRIGAAAADADDRVIYNSATGALLFDADGAGGAAAILFATLDTGLAMTASDFIVI